MGNAPACGPQSVEGQDRDGRTLLLSKHLWLPFGPLIDVAERSGQLRPYVRPVARHLPLAIMGVRMRVRHQSVGRAQGTRLLPVLPELFLTTASHHAVQRFLPDQPGLRPAPTALRQNVTPLLPLRPQHVLSLGRPLYASSTPM